MLAPVCFRARVLSLALALGASTASRFARAEATGAAAANPAVAESAELEQARELYLEGLKHVRDAHWGEALVAFQRSRTLRPHALTTYDIGACERALGHYTRARQELTRALGENTASELPADIVADAAVFLDELERLLVHLTLVVEPVGTTVTFDGRPLERIVGEGGASSFVAGVMPPGRGHALAARDVRVVADPGAHVITLSRHGYGDIVLNRSYRPGQIAFERLALAELPATIRVSANEPLATVSVNGKDVGVAPVDVLRPAGLYRVDVTKPGFVHYSTDVRVMAGEESALRATLVKEKPSLLGKWWFWTAAAAVVGGVATVTFLATRDDSPGQRPPLDGGTLGWVAQLK
jgi:hypothetical protein